MRWVTKGQLKVDLAIARTEAQSYLTQLRSAQEIIAKLERMIDHEREYIDAERRRADRASDAVLQQNGLPPVTDTVVNALDAEKDASEKKYADAQRRNAEFYAESLDDVESDSEISPEIKAMLSEVKEVIS